MSNISEARSRAQSAKVSMLRLQLDITLLQITRLSKADVIDTVALDRAHANADSIRSELSDHDVA